MTDLSKALKVEEMDEGSWINDKGRRVSQLAALPVITPGDKSMFRQLQENNSARDALEELLLRINTVNVEAGTEKTKFSANTKLEIQKNIRAALKQNYEQKMFLKIAKDMGYEAAEAFKSSDPDDKALDDDMKKRFDEIKKTYGAKPKNQNLPQMRKNIKHCTSLDMPRLVQTCSTPISIKHSQISR